MEHKDATKLLLSQGTLNTIYRDTSTAAASLLAPYFDTKYSTVFFTTNGMYDTYTCNLLPFSILTTLSEVT
jgi:hypothetical protein